MSESNQKNSGNEDYDLSVKQAAKALGKSIRTIHRYIDKGKLSRVYVTTDHGKEIRLKSGEVLRLAARLNDDDVEASDQKEDGPFASGNPTQLDIREVLSRYEKTLYQLGEMSAKLKKAKEQKAEKVSALEEERDELKVRLMNKRSQMETLRAELDKPLTFLERLFGHRRN